MNKEPTMVRFLKFIKVLQERKVPKKFMGRDKIVIERRANPWNPLTYLSVLISLIGYLVYHGFSSTGKIGKELKNLFTWS